MIEFIHLAQAAESTASAANEAKSGGALELLGINWKLFIAQLVNFGVIVFILWKWVFTPVTNALENRTKKIEASLHDAEQIKKQLADLESFKTTTERQARADYQKILAEAALAALDQKQKTLAEVKLQAEKMIADAEKRIISDREKTMNELKGEFAGFVAAATEKIIKEKLDSHKDAKFIEQSLNDIR